MDTVEYLYNKSYKMFESLGDEGQIINNIMSLGFESYHNNRYKKCISRLKKIEPYIKHIDPSSDSKVYTFYNTLAKSYYNINKYERAYHYLEKAFLYIQRKKSFFTVSITTTKNY